MTGKVVFLSLVSCVFAGERFLGAGSNRPRFGVPGFVAGAASVDAVHAPQPYSFGYDTVDEFGTRLFHKEQGDANNAKRGSYGYTDANGLYRRVSYVADAGGFRATVDTNEPGTLPGATGDAIFNAKPVVVGPAVKAASSYAAPAYAGKAAGSAYGHGGYGVTGYDRLGYGHHRYGAKS